MIPPSELSVFRFCQAYDAPNGVSFLTDVAPFTYVEREDTIRHVVVGDQSLEEIASIHYQVYGEQAYELMRVIAAFQPDPIFDPTIPLEPGRTILVPSIRAIEEVIYSEDRRLEYEGGD